MGSELKEPDFDRGWPDPTSKGSWIDMATRSGTTLNQTASAGGLVSGNTVVNAGGLLALRTDPLS